jgi:hypothetical protein
MAIWSILGQLGIFVAFMVTWYIFPVLVCMLHQEKSGNPELLGYLTSYPGAKLVLRNGTLRLGDDLPADPKTNGFGWRESRVARWFIFKPKITVWVNVVGP